MTSAADLLKKNKTKSDFVPKTRRAWDFVSTEEPSESDAKKEQDNTVSSQQNLNVKATASSPKTVIKHTNKSRSVSVETSLPKETTQLNKKQKKAVRANQNTNETQTEHKRDTNTTQSEHAEGINPPQTGYKQHTNRAHNSTQVRTSKRRTPEYSKTFSSLSGLQKKLIQALCLNCQLEGGRVTQQLSVDYLASVAGVNKNSVKTTLARLREKGVIDICESKEGRGGWTRFAVSKEFFSDVLCHHQNRSTTPTNQYFSREEYKLNTERHTQPYTNTSSSSSNLNKTTTTYENDLPEDWKKIDIRPLIDIFSTNNSWGKQFFGINQIKTIYKNAGDLLASHQVQESINHFAFGLKHLLSHEPYKSIKKPGAILVDSLKSGDTWDEPNYLNSNEQAMYNVFKKLLNDLNSNAKNSFESWFDEIKDEKYEYYRGKGGSSEYYDMRVFKERAIEDFKETIWPKMRKEKLKEYIADETLIERLFAFHNIVQPQ